MGFILSIFYFVICYLTPVTVLGPLAQYRVSLILAVVILIVSVPDLLRSPAVKTPQSFALIGLASVVFMSVLVNSHWPLGATDQLVEFIPTVYAFFLVSLHFRTRKRLQVLVLVLVCICLSVIAQGAWDLYHGIPVGGPPISPVTGSMDVRLWRVNHHYLIAMKNDAGTWIYRLKGWLGEINDPNDFGQLLVCLIPLVFMFWRRKKSFRNLVLVILPVCALVLGVYLTRSRGALLALVAIALIAARRRFGTVPALVIAGGLFMAAMAAHFTGGRQISAQSGDGREDLWSEGLTLAENHPLFGVGFGQFMQYESNTAHNSIVICVAELGFVGLYFWSLFLYPTARSALLLASPAKVGEGVPLETEEAPYPNPAGKTEQLDKAEINRLGQLLVLSLTGFLVAGYFLSRAFVMTLFLLGGMVEVVYEMARKQEMVAPRPPFYRYMVHAVLLTVSLLALVDVSLRFLNLAQ